MLQHLDKNVTPPGDMGPAGTGVRPTFNAPTVGTLVMHHDHASASDDSESDPEYKCHGGAAPPGPW